MRVRGCRLDSAHQATPSAVKNASRFSPRLHVGHCKSHRRTPQGIIMNFEFQVEFYVVSMAYNPEYTPWTALIVDSVRGAGGARTTFTVFFIPNARSRYPTLGYGTYTGPGVGQGIRVWLDRSEFESFYAILRSERPAFLRGGGSG